LVGCVVGGGGGEGGCGGVGGCVLQDNVFLWELAVCSAEIDYTGVYNTERKLMLTANV